MDDKIIKVIYVRGKLRLLSPVLVGSGEDENSDIDILRDWEGMPFIPGSALAGVLRHYLEERLGEKDVEEVFGKKPKKDVDSTQSLLYFYDAEIQNKPRIQVRDGVALDNIKRTAREKAKYDYEVLERDNIFAFRSKLVIRQRHKQLMKKIESLLYIIVEALKSQRVRLGAKTRRGFGRVKLEDIKLLVLNMDKPEDRRKWIEFNWDFEGNYDINALDHNEFQAKGPSLTKIKVKFSLPYSLMVRHYSSAPEGADMAHLFSAGKPVIPGTSWTGAIRHGMENIGREIGKETEINALIKQLFGFVDGENKQASRIYIEESIIKNEVSLSYTRNKVDRFSGGTVAGALFDERPVFGKNDTEITLDISIKDARDAEIGLLLLALRDLWYGIQTVGGGASIGRGILQGTELVVNGEAINIENNGDKKYLSALASYLGGSYG